MDRYRPILGRRVAGECDDVCYAKPYTSPPPSPQPPPPPPLHARHAVRKAKPTTDLPPLPPPSPPAPPPSLPFVENQGFRLANIIIIAAAIFAASLLLCIIYYAVLRRRRRFPSVAAPSQDEGDASSLGDAEPIHHVWYIRTVGLDESTIASIAVAEYRAGDGLLDGVSDCSVCLGEFRDGERVRLLPKCDHAFHVPCIDTWLRAHVNCPLCRAHIVDQDAEPALPEATHVALPMTAAGESVDMDSGSTVSAEAAQIATLAPEEEAEENRVPETTIETAIQAGTSIVLDSPPESSLSGDQSHLKDNELQPVRRSVSMDAPLTNAIFVAAEGEKDTIFEQESRPKNMGKLGNSSKVVLDQKDHSGVGRSLSSSGRGFFFSRPGRATRIHSMPM